MRNYVTEQGKKSKIDHENEVSSFLVSFSYNFLLSWHDKNCSVLCCESLWEVDQCKFYAFGAHSNYTNEVPSSMTSTFSSFQVTKGHRTRIDIHAKAIGKWIFDFTLVWFYDDLALTTKISESTWSQFLLWFSVKNTNFLLFPNSFLMVVLFNFQDYRDFICEGNRKTRNSTEQVILYEFLKI